MKTAIFKTAITVFLLFFLTQCKKESVVRSIPSNDNSEELSILRTQALQEILTAAKKDEFRQFVLSECLKQKHGDYNVYLKDIVSNFKNTPGYEKATSSLEKIVAQIKRLNNDREPIIFYPKAETIEADLKTKPSLKNVSFAGLEEPIGVFENIFNLDYSSPGYILDDGNELVYYQDITEEYAWDNDVWVIGEEENVSSENMMAAPEDLLSGRVEGQAEYGGIIQVTDLNAIEPWLSGKLEFKIIVLSASGAQISVRAFGKWKRSNFKSQKWKDFGHFIGNWNTSTFGKWMYENWWEEDGGQSNSYTITMPPPSGQTGPTISTTIPSKNRDDNLGIATIQFTDAITQVYSISYANIKRKN